MIDLTDRAAVVTGAGRGIGRAIAQSLAECGASVLVGDIADEREHTVEAIERDGGTAITTEMDVTNRSSIDSAIERAADAFGGVDILVNNAGVFPQQDLDSLSEEDWQWVIDVNLTGVWRCTQSVLPAMRAQEYGRIVNIASIAGGRIGWGPNLSHYAASKGGVVGFTRSAAIGLAPDGITMNAVLPGYVDTPGTQEQSSEEDLQAAVEMTPVGRPGGPEEIGAIVSMLAAEQAGFLTGESIVVDGGITLV